MQVPYESLNRKFRNAQKNIDREISHVNAAATKIGASLVDDSSAESVSELLCSMVAKLKVLKRKVNAYYNFLLFFICNAANIFIGWACIHRWYLELNRYASDIFWYEEAVAVKFDALIISAGWNSILSGG